MPTISLLKKYKEKKSPIAFKKNIELNIFFRKSTVRVYNGKELKKVEVNIGLNHNNKLGELLQTRHPKRKSKKKNKNKKKK